MQRYQVNYKLLVGLVVGAIVVGGALYGLLLVQSYRGAEKLLTMAEQEREAGNIQGAAWNLYRYTQKRRNDEPHAIEMAMTFAEIAEDEEAEPQDRRKALGIMEATVRKWRKNPELRMRLVDLLMKFGATKESAEHLEIMLANDPTNPELLEQLGRCYLRMSQEEKALKHCGHALGYDPNTHEFDPEKAIAPENINLYTQLASALTRTSSDPARADNVMEYMIEVNPASADAYVARARHQLAGGEDKKDAGIADLEKAIELDAQNLDALLVRARLHAIDEEYAEAKELLERGLTVEPEAGTLYLTGAFVASKEEGYDAALDWYERGVNATTGGDQIALKVSQARALINAKQLDQANKLIEELSKLPNLQRDMLDYLRARLMVSQEKWYPASVALLKLRPLLQSNAEISEELNGMLALCYTRLEMWQEADDSAGMVLQINPLSRIARDLQANAQRKLGKDPTTTGEGASINDLVSAELRKPAEERNWDTALATANEYADKMVEDGMMTSAGKNLLLAEILMRAKEYKRATTLIREAIQEESDNINTWRLACRLTAVDPDGGAVKALKMLGEVEKKFEDQPLLRLDRADLYMTLNDEQRNERMLSVAEGIEDWPKREQVMIWQGLATRFEALRAVDELEQARARVAELAPGELSNLLDMFITARTENDDARMADVQEKVLKVVGSKQDANWLYTEAHRLISLYQRGLEDESALEQARQLVQKARQQRPEWHMLYLLLADLAVEQNNPLLALENLDKAASLGPPTARSLLQHVSLLMQSGRFDDARKQLDRASPTFRERLLGRQYAEALLNSRYLSERDKRWEESIEAAQAAAELNPDNGETQLWLGRFMMRAARHTRLADSTRESAKQASGEAFRKAVELMPSSEEAWLSYIGYLSTTDDPKATEEAVRELQLALDEDALPLVLAAGYELQNRWFDAENVYKRALESNPDNLSVMRRMASFYLGNAYQRPDKLQKATPIINRLMKNAEQDPGLSTRSEVMWARRTAAKILAQTGDYQNALDAERLLRSNLVNGQLTTEDKMTMAKILATRPEPGSKLKAIALYENILETRDLPPLDQLTLGQLYFATNNWEECERVMTEVTSRNRDFVAARDAYIRMLLVHDAPGDLKTAANQLKNLQRVAPTEPSTLELLVRISSKMGRKQDVGPVLQRLLKRPENAKNPQVIVRIAKLLADLDSLETAEKLFQFATRLSPGANLEYADFLGRHQSLDAALDLLDQAKDSEEKLEVPAIQYASALLKYKGDDATDEQFDRVYGWLQRSLREDPESVRLLMQKAELLDTHRQYEESGDVYRSLLDRKDVKGFDRAIVLNNLAYQLAMTTTDERVMEAAMGYVAEAADILGPRSDILDTRAVVHMSMGHADAAVADMELAVTDGPTASKYFHKSRAHLLAGQTEKAVAAWDIAVDMGLNPNEIGLVEREAYDKVESQINRLKSSGGADRPAA